MGWNNTKRHRKNAIAALSVLAILSALFLWEQDFMDYTPTDIVQRQLAEEAQLGDEDDVDVDAAAPTIDTPSSSSSLWTTCPANKILPNVATASINAPSIKMFGQVPLMFISNTKCGSTSLSERFNKTLGKMRRLYLFRDATLLKEWDTSVVLSIIRNPWTRFCSIYDYCQKDEHRKGSLEEYPSFLETSKDPSILGQHCQRAPSHWMPYLNKFLDEDDDGASGVYYDCMLRLEHLDEDWDDFRLYTNETIGYDVGELPGHTNARHTSEERRLLKSDPCQDYYEANPESVGYVHEFYFGDIEHFGYSYPYEHEEIM